MNPTLQTIDTQTLAYAPAVLVAIQAAESLAPNASGKEKAAAVIGSLSGALAGSSNANVAGIALLVNLFVAIANATGAFKHKTAAPASATKPTEVV